MARRGNTKNDEVVADEAVETVEVEETEATEEPTEAPEKVEVVFDLEPFKAAVEAALTEADTSTGDLPPTATDAVNKVYRGIDGVKGKNQARAYLDESMKAAVVAKDIVRAKSFINLKDDLSAGSSGTPKAPADPTTAFVQKVVALNLATGILLGKVPEGVSDDWSEKADALASELQADVEAWAAFQANDDEDEEAPEVSPVVRQAFKLSTLRGGAGTGTPRPAGAPRRDTEAHINQVFADLPSGSFLTAGEISRAKSEEYGDDRPSSGAISARLFPKGKEPYRSETIAAHVPEDGGSKGAIKL